LFAEAEKSGDSAGDDGDIKDDPTWISPCEYMGVHGGFMEEFHSGLSPS